MTKLLRSTSELFRNHPRPRRYWPRSPTLQSGFDSSPRLVWTKRCRSSSESFRNTTRWSCAPSPQRTVEWCRQFLRTRRRSHQCHTRCAARFLAPYGLPQNSSTDLLREIGTPVLSQRGIAPLDDGSSRPNRAHPPLVDVLHTLCFGLRPQMAPPLFGFALAEGKRVKLLRVRPHNPKAERDVAIRRRGVVAPRNARARCGVVPRAATEHPVRAGRWTDWISRRQGFIGRLIPVPHPLPNVPTLIVQPSSVCCLGLHCSRRVS